MGRVLSLVQMAKMLRNDVHYPISVVVKCDLFLNFFLKKENIVRNISKHFVKT